jgi:hypothetical protein
MLDCSGSWCEHRLLRPHRWEQFAAIDGQIATDCGQIATDGNRLRTDCGQIANKLRQFATDCRQFATICHSLPTTNPNMPQNETEHKRPEYLPGIRILAATSKSQYINAQAKRGTLGWEDHRERSLGCLGGWCGCVARSALLESYRYPKQPTESMVTQRA